MESEKVFFGGISVYLEQYVPYFVTASLARSLGDSKPMLRLASRRSISTVRRCWGNDRLDVEREDGFQHKEIEKLLIGPN